jgi:hypothetical protein
MKLLKLFFILSILAISSVLPVSAQTPQDIVNKCITALGGEEAVRNFINYKAAGEIDYLFGTQIFKGKIKVLKRGEKFWTKIDFSIGNYVLKVFRVFDGKNAWTDQNGTITDMPALNYHSELAHTPLLLLEKQAAFTLAERTEIKGKTVIGIEVTFKNKKTTFLIDQTDHTLREVRYSDLFFSNTLTKETLEKRIRYLDYKKVKGFMFPSRIIHYLKGKKQMELYLHDITFNPELPSILLLRPDRELDLRYMEERYE